MRYRLVCNDSSVTGRSAHPYSEMSLILLILLIMAACSTPSEPNSAPPPATSPPSESLPQSLKGYELSVSSWQGEYYFTLNVGLNRLRPCEKRDDPLPDNVPSYTVKSVAALKAALGQLQSGEDLLLCPFESPDQRIIDDIEMLSEQLDVNLAKMALPEAR